MISFTEITSRDKFIQFIETLTEDADIHFAKKFCLDFHDRFYTFENTPPVALEEEGKIKCVLFVNYTKLDKYVSIINILTPTEYRGHGYAKMLLKYSVIYGMYNRGCTRIRFNADIDAVPFYNSMNCIYVGKTRSGDFYCNMPITSDVLQDDELNFNVLHTMDMTNMMDRSSINLVKRRLDMNSSWDVYNCFPSYLPVSSYKHKEFVETYGRDK